LPIDFHIKARPAFRSIWFMLTADIAVTVSWLISTATKSDHTTVNVTQAHYHDTRNNPLPLCKR